MGRHSTPAGPGRRQVLIIVGLLLLAAAAAVTFAVLRSEEAPVELQPIETTSSLSDISSAVDSQTTTPSATTTFSPPTISPDATLTKSAEPPKPKPRFLATVALQPSHQDDTGEGWHEYVICADIARRTSASERRIKWVIAQDTKHGLTGSNNYRPRPSNTPAFDKEVGIANAARAGYFISIHNDGGAPSGILGEYMPGDERGARLTKYLVDRLSGRLGLPNRGTREVRLYSLEPERNHARYRSLLEIGDNVADRAYLSSAANRRKIGRVLAAALVDFAGANDGR